MRRHYQKPKMLKNLIMLTVNFALMGAGTVYAQTLPEYYPSNQVDYLLTDLKDRAQKELAQREQYLRDIQSLKSRILGLQSEHLYLKSAQDRLSAKTDEFKSQTPAAEQMQGYESRRARLQTSRSQAQEALDRYRQEIKERLQRQMEIKDIEKELKADIQNLSANASQLKSSDRDAALSQKTQLLNWIAQSGGQQRQLQEKMNTLSQRLNDLTFEKERILAASGQAGSPQLTRFNQRKNSQEFQSRANFEQTEWLNKSIELLVMKKKLLENLAALSKDRQLPESVVAEDFDREVSENDLLTVLGELKKTQGNLKSEVLSLTAQKDELNNRVANLTSTYSSSSGANSIVGDLKGKLVLALEASQRKQREMLMEIGIADQKNPYRLQQIQNSRDQRLLSENRVRKLQEELVSLREKEKLLPEQRDQFRQEKFRRVDELIAEVDSLVNKRDELATLLASVKEATFQKNLAVIDFPEDEKSLREHIAVLNGENAALKRDLNKLNQKNKSFREKF